MYKYYFIIIGFLLAGCKDIYDPDIDNEKTALVVQGLMTNIHGRLSVKISNAVPFDSTMNSFGLRGLSVSVIDDLGNRIPLFDNGFGTYQNPDAVGIPGRSYYLHIETTRGDIYESDRQTMPQPFKQDSIYAESISRTVFLPSSSGDYFESKRVGIETYVDLRSGNNEFPKCRYEAMVTLLYAYTAESGTPPPTIYCWKSFRAGIDVNLTESKFERTMGYAPKHVISFFGTSIELYDDRDIDFSVYGWLLTLQKFSLSTETHQYYANIKNQLEASGKIFDPLPSQLKGNIRCINHPEKLAFGFFEVSYQENLYYRYKIGQRIVSLTPKNEFPQFIESGEVVGIPPAFWNN